MSLEEDEFKSKLRENERIVKRLEREEGWHAILHRDQIGMSQLFKTAYRRTLFRDPVLTNQRFILFKDGEIDYEAPLGNILEVKSNRHLRIGTPYLTLQLNDGETVHLVFESISERVYIGAAVEAEMAWKYTKEWTDNIRVQTGRARTKEIQRPPPPPQAAAEAAGTKYCQECGAKLPLQAAFCLQCGAKQT